MKLVFEKSPALGTIPLHSSNYTGQLHAKKLTQNIFIKLLFASNLKILLTHEIIFKLTPRVFGLFTLQLRMLHTTRLPPRTNDWNVQPSQYLYNKHNQYDEATFTTTCFICENKERIVNIASSRPCKGVFICPKPFSFPWIHLGDVIKMFNRIGRNLPPDSRFNVAQDSD